MRYSGGLCIICELQYLEQIKNVSRVPIEMRENKHIKEAGTCTNNNYSLLLIFCLYFYNIA